MFQENLRKEIGVVPSPLRGEGQGGGEYDMVIINSDHPPPNPLPSREG
jgi:hypothetical protein